MTKTELKELINEMVSEELLNERMFNSVTVQTDIDLFKTLYKKAMSEKSQEVIDRAIKHYNDKLKPKMDKISKFEIKKLEKMYEELKDLNKSLHNTITPEKVKELNIELKECVKYLNTQYNKLKNTAEFKKKISQTIEKYNKDMDYDSNLVLKPDFVPDVKISVDSDFSLGTRDTFKVEAVIDVIPNEDKEVCIWFDWIAKSLCKLIKAKYKNFKKCTEWNGINITIYYES